jgi:hypothetical protein
VGVAGDKKKSGVGARKLPRRIPERCGALLQSTYELW